MAKNDRILDFQVSMELSHRDAAGGVRGAKKRKNVGGTGGSEGGVSGGGRKIKVGCCGGGWGGHGGANNWAKKKELRGGVKICL